MAIDSKWLYEYVLARFSSVAEMESFLPQPKTAEELQAVSDDRYLSLITQRVFRAGLRHAMVDQRWPAFDEAFWGFEPKKMILLSGEHFERFMRNKELIRHLPKMKSIPINAQMVLEISNEYGSFGKFLAQWPSTDIVNLWRYLQKQGAQLGGMSAPSFLRMAGKDTFILNKDVTTALVAQGVIDRQPTTIAALAACQHAFNQLQQDSSRPLCQLSMMLSMTVNH